MNKNKIDYLLNWDKKHKDYLIKFYLNEVESQDFINDLIEWSYSNHQILTATTWLIKHHIDNKNQLNNEQKNRILKFLDLTNEWDAKLHIYQILPKIKIDDNNAKYLEAIIYKDLNSDNKFLKAAAFEAYFEIVKILKDLENEFISICQNSLEKESASVKVKIRRILKSLNP